MKGIYIKEDETIRSMKIVSWQKIERNDGGREERGPKEEKAKKEGRSKEEVRKK